MGLQSRNNAAEISLTISLITLVTLTSCLPQEIDSQTPHRREKRHILQMCELVAAHTNRGCLDYNNYGCFCGLGNAASAHVDGVDGCCRVHDRCYGEVACFWMYPQFVGYSVECNNASCECTDSPIFSPCAYTTCQCDLELARCLGRSTYNHGFSNFDRRECNRPVRLRTQRRRRQTKKKRKKKWAKSLLHKLRRSFF